MGVDSESDRGPLEEQQDDDQVTSDGEGGERFTYEQQRWFPFAGWGKKSLPTDFPEWGVGKKAVRREAAAIPLNTEWCGPWEVDTDIGDDEGWEYAGDWWWSYHDAKKATDCVRRRRWRRNFAATNTSLNERRDEGVLCITSHSDKRLGLHLNADTMVLTDVSLDTAADDAHAGRYVGTRLLTVEGQPVANLKELKARLSKFKKAPQIALGFEISNSTLSEAKTDFQSLFSGALPATERPVDNFKCTYTPSSIGRMGSMYITQNYVCFHSRMCAPLILPFAKIVRVEKKSGALTSGIVVVTKEESESGQSITQHHFSGFFSRDNAYGLLERLRSAHEQCAEAEEPPGFPSTTDATAEACSPPADAEQSPCPAEGVPHTERIVSLTLADLREAPWEPAAALQHITPSTQPSEDVAQEGVQEEAAQGGGGVQEECKSPDDGSLAAADASRGSGDANMSLLSLTGVSRFGAAEGGEAARTSPVSIPVAADATDSDMTFTPELPMNNTPNPLRSPKHARRPDPARLEDDQLCASEAKPAALPQDQKQPQQAAPMEPSVVGNTSESKMWRPPPLSTDTPTPVPPLQSERRRSRAPPPMDSASPARTPKSPVNRRKSELCLDDISTPTSTKEPAQWKDQRDRLAELNRMLPEKPVGADEQLVECYKSSFKAKNYIDRIGSFWLTDKRVIFTSSFISPITIPFTSIREVVKKKDLVILNAIAIRTDKQTYTFTAFMQRDAAFALLYNLWSVRRGMEGGKGGDAEGSDPTSQGAPDDTPPASLAPLIEPVAAAGAGGEPGVGSIAAMSEMLQRLAPQVEGMQFTPAADILAKFAGGATPGPESKHVVSGHRLPENVPLASVFDSLLSSPSKFLSQYHGKRQSYQGTKSSKESIKLAEWAHPEEVAGGGVGMRSFTCTAVVYAPWEKHTRYVESQRYGCFVDKENGDAPTLLMHCASQTPDVTFGDSFRVEALLKFTESRADGGGSPRCTLDIYSHLHFFSQPMMKAKIISSAATELLNSYKMFCEMANQAISKRRKQRAALPRGGAPAAGGAANTPADVDDEEGDEDVGAPLPQAGPSVDIDAVVSVAKQAAVALPAVWVVWAVLSLLSAVTQLMSELSLLASSLNAAVACAEGAGGAAGADPAAAPQCLSQVTPVAQELSTHITSATLTLLQTNVLFSGFLTLVLLWVVTAAAGILYYTQMKKA